MAPCMFLAMAALTHMYPRLSSSLSCLVPMYVKKLVTVYKRLNRFVDCSLIV
jgi:hypothetical protein